MRTARAGRLELLAVDGVSLRPQRLPYNHIRARRKPARFPALVEDVGVRHELDEAERAFDFAGALRNHEVVTAEGGRLDILAVLDRQQRQAPIELRLGLHARQLPRATEDHRGVAGHERVGHLVLPLRDDIRRGNLFLHQISPELECLDRFGTIKALD